MKLTTKPWTNDTGGLLSDKDLREVSANWSAETWEQFLVDTVEGSSSYQREELISPYTYDQALEASPGSIWQSAIGNGNDEKCELVRRICRDHLTPKQQCIVRMTYWDGFSERRICEVMNLSRSTVVGHKRDSLRKIKGLIETRRSNFPRYEKAFNQSPDQNGESGDYIHEVYLEEISHNQFGKFRG